MWMHTTVYQDILATILIWQFGDLQVNCQNKKSPISRYQSWPDKCAAPSSSSNKCARVSQRTTAS